MNKKGQISDMVFLAGYSIAILLVGIFLYFIFSTILTKTAITVSSIDNVSANAINYGVTSFDRFWDYVILAFLFFNIISLFITSFLVDIHPAYSILYIVGAFVLVLMLPTFQGTIGSFYDVNGTFGSQLGNMSGSLWFYNNFVNIMLGVIFISGIILFAKYKFGAGGQSNNVYR